jgi:hypothetical protein
MICTCCVCTHILIVKQLQVDLVSHPPNPLYACTKYLLGYGCGFPAPQLFTKINRNDIYNWIIEVAGEPDTPVLKYNEEEQEQEEQQEEEEQEE